MIIHIGYHKTGTTWMQRHVFVEELGFQQILNHAEVHKLINKIPYLAFSREHIKLVLDYVNARIQSALDRDLIPVISSELICGSPLDGGARSYENMEKIRCLFPHADVLIGVRNQKDAISSIYNQWVKMGGTSSIRTFIAPGENDYSHSTFSLGHYQYDRLVRAYMREFGENKVHVLPYELYEKDKAPVFRILSTFSTNLSAERFAAHMQLNDKEVNTGLAPMAIPLLRFFNIFCRNYNHPYALLNLERFRLTVLRSVKVLFGNSGLHKRQIKKIEGVSKDFFAESNRALSSSIGIDLGSYGYDV